METKDAFTAVATVTGVLATARLQAAYIDAAARLIAAGRSEEEAHEITDHLVLRAMAKCPAPSYADIVSAVRSWEETGA